MSGPLDILQIQDPFYGRPAIAMATAAASNQHYCRCRGEKVVSATTPAVKEMCVFAVCLFTKCESLSPAVIDIVGTTGVCLYVCAFSLVEARRQRRKTPCGSLIGPVPVRECDGRGAIDIPVVVRGCGVTALWSTIKRTRQIGRGAPARGRPRREGTNKDEDGDPASHNSGPHKRPTTAR